MKSICILANKYPNPIEPNACVFIQQLVWMFADMGYQCSVIVPMPLNFNIKYWSFPPEATEVTENGAKIKIYYPKYFSLGQSSRLFQKNRVAITTAMFTKAVESVLKYIPVKPDILYAHFLCPAGVSASVLGKKYSIKTFLACGEAVYSGDRKYGNKKLEKKLLNLNGVIAVSSHNKEFLIDADIVQESKIKVFPNGYRGERFFPRQKAEARKRFGFPVGAFIVGMCGSFDKRKGVMRLQNAVEQIPNVYFACAGKGKLVPGGERCLWAKPVNNEELSWFYSALDVFVLPTTNEGCCNAIIEAMACGCPIISSDRSFNDEICDTTNSILVDPMDIEAIRDAIIELKEHDGKRMQLAQGSIEKSKELRISERAKRIIEFMESKF